MTMNATIPSALSNRDLVAEVARLAGEERQATASLIAHLTELYRRRLHERAGFSSLFTYCTQILHLSEHEAYDRMKAAKVVRRYPAVPGLLVSGRGNLTTVRLLAPYLTRTNHDDLLAAAAGKRKRQVQELLAERFPRPDVASSVRKLPIPSVVPAPMVAVTPAVTAVLLDTSANAALAGEVPARAPIPAAPPPLIEPLAPARYRVTFTVGAETCEKLELAQDRLRHAIPSGDPAQIFARALDVLLEELVKRKYAATPRPRPSPGQGGRSRHIPAAVKRAVFIRDRGRCAFVGSHGRRCGERAFVEFRHLRPHAAGGEPTLDNIELRCRVHNAYGAELFFGRRERDTQTDVVSEGATPYDGVKDDASRSGTSHRRRWNPLSARKAPLVDDRSRRDACTSP